MELLKRNIFTLLTILFFCPLVLVAQQKNVHNLKTPLSVRNFDEKKYDKQNSAIYFEKDSSNDNVGRLVINLNTKNQDCIKVSWQSAITKRTNTKWFARLQYRLSEEDEWKDVKDKRGHNIEYVSQKKRYARNFNDIELDEQCNNKDFVQISWLIDTYTNNKNGYPNILFRNIEITSRYDEYFGIPAKVNVYLSSDEDKNEVNSLIFDKISLPYIYPASKRLVIEGKNIRDSISLNLRGADANYFRVSEKYIAGKENVRKTITVDYVPKKEGRHRAELIVSTSKLQHDIEIPLEAFSAKQVAYDENMLPMNLGSTGTNNLSYNIPVFSNTDYQYRFSQDEKSYQPIKIRYRWYRDGKLLSSLKDETKGTNYIAELKSPAEATNLEVELMADDMISFKNYYFGSPKVKTMIHSGLWSDKNNWEDGKIPTIEDMVVIDHGVMAKIDSDVQCKMLTLGDSANVSIAVGKSFYVPSSIFYGKNAWFTVHQYLLPGKWNYISSPVNQAHAALFSMTNLAADNDSWFMQYNTGKKSKHDDYWSEYITDPKFTLTPARGYAVYTQDAVDVKYEGLLCNSNVAISLVTTMQDRWNLIGNPYTAPISSKKLFDDIDGQIQGNTILIFDKQTRLYNPIIINDKEEFEIPPLESFFVEALDRPTEIVFKRSQQYIPNEPTDYNLNYLKLSVDNGISWQYALLGVNPNSKVGFDHYDCHKMFGSNDNLPDIYLFDDKDEYSVNIFPKLPAVYDVGLYVGKAADAYINLNNLSVLPDDVRVFIENKLTNGFEDLCTEGNYEISLVSGTTENYRLHIVKATTMQSSDVASGIYVWQDKNRLLFYSDGSQVVEKIRLIRYANTIFEQDYNQGEIISQPFKPNNGYKLEVFVNNAWQEVQIQLN